MADDIQPNYIHVDPVTGQTSIQFDNATFTNATITNATITGATITDATITGAEVTKLILPAGANAAPPIDDRVSWTSDGTSSGALVADVTAWTTGVEDHLTLTCYDTTNPASSIQAVVGSQFADILRASGQSSFLQLGASQASQAGQGTFFWPGGGRTSNPNLIDLTPLGAGLAAFAVGSVDGINHILDGVTFDAHNNGNGTVTIRGIANALAPAGGASCPYAYLAWGF